jgi:hypothetical protein
VDRKLRILAVKKEPAAHVHIRPWGCSQFVSRVEWGNKYIFEKQQQKKPIRNQQN